MTISYPLSLPAASRSFSQLTITGRSVVGMSTSPFSLTQQVQDSLAEAWILQATLPPLKRADGELYVAWKLALRGRRGTFLAGDVANPTPRGTWAGSSPLVMGAGQVGYVLDIDGLVPGRTGLEGDWFQLGSGASSRMYKLTKAFTANGSGQATLDFFPQIRETPVDNASLTLSSPKAVWRLDSNDSEWSIDVALTYGLSISAMEAI